MNMNLRNRPIRVTLLALLVLFFALLNLLRLGESIYFWKTLLEYGTQPLYLALSGGFWVIVCFLLVWGLWVGKRWIWLATVIGTVVYSVWYWLDRLLLQQPHTNNAFVLGATVVILLLIFLVLFSSRTRRYFLKESHV
jgi:Na+/melibiose symporter-like transporter